MRGSFTDTTGLPKPHLLSSFHQFWVMQDVASSVCIRKVQVCKGTVSDCHHEILYEGCLAHFHMQCCCIHSRWETATAMGQLIANLMNSHHMCCHQEQMGNRAIYCYSRTCVSKPETGSLNGCYQHQHFGLWDLFSMLVQKKA